MSFATKLKLQERRIAESPSTLIEPPATFPSICSNGYSSKEREIIFA